MERKHDKACERPAVIDLLQQHGIQPTQQRIQIAQVLFARDRHLSAEDVLDELKQSAARVSKATIYNTLGLFASKGLIREVIVDPTRIFYDPNTRPHHHFYNVDTGKLMDIPADSLTLGEMPLPPRGTVAEGVDVIIRVRDAG